MVVAEREGIAAADQAGQRRWDRWQSRYQRDSRRTTRQARVVAAVIFLAIVANLVVQLLSAGRVWA